MTMIEYLRSIEASWFTVFLVGIVAIALIVALVVVIWLLVRKKDRLNLELAILTQGRPAPGAVKFAYSLPLLRETANETIQRFGEDGLPLALFGVKRTLKKLGLLSEHFILELREKIAEMRNSLEQEHRQKEILECSCSSNGDEAARRKATDQNTEKILNLTTGIQNAERLLNAWRMV